MTANIKSWNLLQNEFNHCLISQPQWWNQQDKTVFADLVGPIRKCLHLWQSWASGPVQVPSHSSWHRKGWFICHTQKHTVHAQTLLNVHFIICNDWKVKINIVHIVTEYKCKSMWNLLNRTKLSANLSEIFLQSIQQFLI